MLKIISNLQEEAMGKKKSVALIVLISLILAVLLAMSVASFSVPSTVKNYNSLLSVIDLGCDLGGGYQTVMYPEGVISKEEYQSLVEADEASAEDYTAYKGVYLSTDIYSNNEISETFQSEFDTALKIIQRRYENKGFSDYKLRVQDDYTIIAEIPDTDEDADNVFEKLALSGMLTFRSSASTANSRNVLMEGTSEYIKSVEVSGSDETYYVVLNFTKAGRKEFTKITTELAASSSSDSSSGSSSGASLYVFMGTEQLMNVSVTEAIDQNYVAISGFTTRSTATSVSVVLDTALHESDRFDLTFTNSGAASFTATMGEHTALYIAIAFGVAVLAMIVAFLIRYKGMGLAHVYGFLSFAVIYILCIALIDGIQLTMGGVIAILLASVIALACNLLAFKNISDEFYSGKTLNAAVKSGYKKSLAFTIDIHVILLIAAIVLWLISASVVNFAALIFLIGIVISALTTLLLTRFYLYLFLSSAKNKIAFCNFKREELEDD